MVSRSCGQTKREILFRGKQAANEKWVIGYLSSKHTITIQTSCGHTDEIVICTDTVGQFTGLTDKNGKKIFEGDIIKIPDDYDEFCINAGEVYEVYFAFGGFRLKPKYSKAKGFWLEDDKTVEIIGNIHDNPELLEVSDND